MAWTYEYYCARLGVTFKQGDKFIVKGVAYRNSGPAASVGYDYSNEPTEKAFYGAYSNPDSPSSVAHPICFMDSYGDPQYYISDADIYANVSGTLDTYTYSFNANGGTGAPSALTKTHGANFTFPSSKPSRTGYTFNGWYNSSVNSGRVYSAGQTVLDLPNTNITWYAAWSANDYVITYKSNGGSGSDVTQGVSYGTAWTTFGRTYSKTGYTQTSWNTRSDGSGTTYGLNTQQTNAQLNNLTLYAIYTANYYDLTVNPNGGTWNGSTGKQTYSQKYGSTKAIGNPTRVGYQFKGWSLSGYGSFSGSTYTYGAGSGTLTAQWERIVLTVTFNASANGGSPNSTKNIYYGDTVGSLPTPQKKYYKFVGWFTKATGGVQVSASQVITSNITYYAQFKIDASVKIGQNGDKSPAIVWVGQNGVWSKVVAWIGGNGKWDKSSGAD